MNMRGAVLSSDDLQRRAVPSLSQRSRRLPTILSRGTIADLRVSPRTLRCVASLPRPAGFLRAVDLSGMELDRLLALESFGKTSFFDLLGELRPYRQDVTADRKPISPLLAGALEKLRDWPACGEIFGQDPRFR